MTNIKLFQGNKIRSTWNEDEGQWYFSVVDVVEVLTDSPNPRQYWRKMKDRDLKEYESYPFWVQLNFGAALTSSAYIPCAAGVTRYSANSQIPHALHLGLLKETCLRCSVRWDYSLVDMYRKGAINTPYVL